MICPNCQISAVISEQLYGALYTCGGCQAVYFINFEGEPEFGEVPSGILTDIVSEPESADSDQLDQSAVTFESPFESSLEPLIDSVDIVNFENKLDEQFDSQFVDSSGLQSEANLFESQLLNIESSKPNAFANIAKEISDFGNTEVQLSAMNYDLNITGLDTQQVVRLFKEAVEDSKFGWDVNELLGKIKNGQIKLERLSPVKAYILAKRLQFLDIGKHWTQNAMS